MPKAWAHDYYVVLEKITASVILHQEPANLNELLVAQLLVPRVPVDQPDNELAGERLDYPIIG